MRRILSHTCILFTSVLIAAFVIDTVEGRTNQGKMKKKKPFTSRLQRVRATAMKTSRITFPTSDGVTIVGDWYAVDRPKGAVLFLHMMPAVRGSWKSLAQELQKQQIMSLAIDLRGHGESTNKGGLDYTTFSDAEQQQTRLDVAAAVAWLKAKGAKEQKIILVGASIGANLAIEYSAAHKAIPGVAVLSPGLDYHGVVTEPAARLLQSSQKLFLAASAPDDQYSYDTIVALAAATKAQVTKQALTNRGHGTEMTDSDQKLSKTLIQWIITTLRR
ncbi:alpha/beta fold hydrolase [Candidatus Uhrbacteria bacterium]|nr:alpha/beta fold hydrolase [Candidatus Uhrbacteria bacterium]